MFKRELPFLNRMTNSNRNSVTRVWDEKCDKGWAQLMNLEHEIAVNYLLAQTGIEIPNNASVIDVGCANGWVLRKLVDEYKIAYGLGLDLSNKMIEEAREKSSEYKMLDFKVDGWEDIVKYSLQHGLFDVILGVESIYFYGSVVDNIRNAFNSLKDGGYLGLNIECYKIG